MTCVHKIRWSVKRPEDCRFHLSVSHYKDRIVAPDEYSGATVVTPSDSEQVLPTTDKLVRDDITVNPAPTEYLSTDHNGTFVPSSGKVGFYQVDVDVQPDLRPLSVSENGQYSPDDFDGYSDVTVDVEPALESLSVTENGLYLPDSDVDGFDRVSVSVPQPSGSINITANGTYDVTDKVSAVINVPATGYDGGTLVYEGDFSSSASQWAVTELSGGQAFAFDKLVVEFSGMGQGINIGCRQYWRSDLPMMYNQTYMFNPGSMAYISGATALKVQVTIEVENSTYNCLKTVGYDADNPTATKATMVRIAHGGYDKITAYGWWSWSCPAGAHIKITGYNRTV